MSRTRFLLCWLLLCAALLAACRPDSAGLAPELSPEDSGNPGSARNAAVEVADSGFDCDQVSDIPYAECQALVAFYEATGGPRWLDQEAAWEEGATAWLASTTPCNWAGVTCAGGHVDMLALFYNDLQGQLPAELASLSALRVLDLHHNALDGQIPAALGELSNLESLDLSGNRLSGAIPPAQGNLQKLSMLALSGNQLSGPIPPELGRLGALRILDLSANQLSGEIPAAVGELPSLETLRLGNNQLEGAIPASLGQLPSLAEIDLSFNRLSGPVPAGLEPGIRRCLWGNWLEGAIAVNEGEVIAVHGVQFAADPTLAASVWPERIPAVAPFPGAAWWDTMPPHVRLTLAGAQGPSAHAPMGINVPGEAQIHVYPVAALDEVAQEQVAALKALLATDVANPGAPLPLLPVTNAAQLFQAKVSPLAFHEGTGIRYLTQQAQGPVPASNDQIFYTFQGLTADGVAYVAAFFPVSTALLPATAREAVALPAAAAFLAGSDSGYLTATVQALNESADDAFSPALSRIDALIASLTVDTQSALSPAAALQGRWPDDGEAVDGAPVLQWEGFPAAADYELVVVDDDAYPPVVAFTHTGPETEVVVTPPLDPGSYSWTVRALAGDGALVAELNRQFWVKAELAGVYPPAAEVIDAEPVLQWQPFDGAIRYEVTVVDDGAYPPEVVFTATTTEPQVSVSPALPEGRHYTWTVWAQEEGGRKVAELNSDFAVYSQLAIVQPSAGAQVGPQPTLQWQPFPGAASYDVTIVTGYPPLVVFAATTSTPQVTVTPPLSAGDTHYWTVWARDSDGRLVAALASTFDVAP
jgi:hypothetical protein